MGRLIDEDEALFMLTTSMMPQSMEYTSARTIARDLIKQTPTALTWKKVEENPLPLEEVLCCNKFGEIMIGYIGKCDGCFYAESNYCTMYDVTHWMELPLPPALDKSGNLQK